MADYADGTHEVQRFDHQSKKWISDGTVEVKGGRIAAASTPANSLLIGGFPASLNGTYQQIVRNDEE